MKVILAQGQHMPRHFASSDAFLIIEKGQAQLSLPDKEVMLVQGTTFQVPAGVPHTLQVLADFEAFVVLAANANILFTD